MTLNLKAKIYNDEAAARQHLEAIQWPEGPVCPHCGVINEATALSGKSTRPGVYKCRPCQKPFSVTVGTVFERSKVPLTKWLLATELLTSSKKGVSAHQIHRMLGVTYKTAWFMMHRIREAMKPTGADAGPLGGEGKIVEADETYIGKADGRRKKINAGGAAHKQKVLSLVERGGKIRSFKIGGTAKSDIIPVLHQNIDLNSTLHTDGAHVYRDVWMIKGHEAVDHSKEYVREGKAGIPPGIYTQPNQLYFYMTRYLIERISWICRDYAGDHGGDRRAKIIFSRRGGMSYPDFRSYLERLQQQDTNIHWACIDVDGIEARDHSKHAGLQLADSVASAFAAGVEFDAYGNSEYRYAEAFRRATYNRKKTI